MVDDQLEIARLFCPDFDRLNPDEKWRALIDAMIDNPAMRTELKALTEKRKANPSAKSRSGRKRKWTAWKNVFLARQFKAYRAADPRRAKMSRSALVPGFRRHTGLSLTRLNQQLGKAIPALELYRRYIQLERNSPSMIKSRPIKWFKEASMTNEELLEMIKQNELRNMFGWEAIRSAYGITPGRFRRTFR
jgi:AraC-like DNA-binding protein